MDLLPFDLITQLFKILSIETKKEKGLFNLGLFFYILNITLCVENLDELFITYFGYS